MKNNQKGFTLVELSIVLVIIGLIVGGIVGGQSLIRSGEIQSVATDVQKIKTAIKAYELQFDALPGDMIDAWDYFDGTTSSTAICGADTAGVTTSCNGNGNNQISVDLEEFRFWQHLSLSSIYPGTFSGLKAPGIVGKTNVPSSKLGGADVYRVLYTDYSGASGVNLQNHIRFGKASEEGSITGREARQIDLKLDDGVANTGSVIAINPLSELATGDCVSGNATTATTFNYTLSTTTKECRLAFKL